MPLYAVFRVNVDFLAHLQKHLSNKNWKMLLAGFQKGVDSFHKFVQEGRSSLSYVDSVAFGLIT